MLLHKFRRFGFSLGTKSLLFTESNGLLHSVVALLISPDARLIRAVTHLANRVFLLIVDSDAFLREHEHDASPLRDLVFYRSVVLLLALDGALLGCFCYCSSWLGFRSPGDLLTCCAIN